VKRYPVVIEKAGNNYSAYAPDIDGCIATGKTVEETKNNIREALEFHFEGMAANNETIPEPTTEVAYVEVNVPVKA
jgi:predicted RNase H-like HicB family nuclease